MEFNFSTRRAFFFEDMYVPCLDTHASCVKLNLLFAHCFCPPPAAAAAATASSLVQEEAVGVRGKITNNDFAITTARFNKQTPSEWLLNKNDEYINVAIVYVNFREFANRHKKPDLFTFLSVEIAGMCWNFLEKGQ